MTYRAHTDLLSHVLDEDEVDELISMYKKGDKIVAMAAYFGVHRNTITNVLDRARRAGRL